MRRVGVFGGSFNPIHVGHIALAKSLREQAELDEVWFMVSPQNPFKVAATDLLADELRLQLVCDALKGENGLKPCDYEFHLPKPSYSWNTLQAMSKDFPDVSFTLLIGGDNWASFDKWYHHEDILAHYPIVVYPRKGSAIDTHILPPHVTLVDTPLYDVSSTEIRDRIANHCSIQGLVPESIEKKVQDFYQK